MEKTFKIDQNAAHMLSLPVLRSKLRSNAPYIDGQGMQEYRRMRGLIVDGAEIRAYAQVFLFLPTGMPAAVEPCIALIKAVFAQQGLELRFFLHITSYGEPAEALHATSFQVSHYTDKIAREVERLAGEAHTPPHILSTLRLMPTPRNTKIARDDLVFVVTGRLEDFAISESVKNSLSRHSNSYIVSLSDNIQACRFKELSFVENNVLAAGTSSI